MAEKPSNRTAIRASVSLRPDQYRGVLRMAEDERHGKFSRIIQDLLEKELRARYGSDWPRIIAADTAGSEAVAA